MKILEEKQENINKNYEIAIKRIKEDIEKKKIEHEHKMKEMEKKGEINCALYQNHMQNIEMDIKKMENEFNKEMENIKRDSEKRIQEIKNIGKKKLENLNNEYRIQLEQLEEEHQRIINENNFRMNQMIMAYQNNSNQVLG